MSTFTFHSCRASTPAALATREGGCSRHSQALLAVLLLTAMTLLPLRVLGQAASPEVRLTSFDSVWTYYSAGWYRGGDSGIYNHSVSDWSSQVWIRAGATNQWLFESTFDGPNFVDWNMTSTNYHHLVEWWPDLTQLGTRWWTNASVAWELAQQVLDDHTTGTEPDQPVPLEPAPWLYIRHAFTNIWSNLDPGNENEGEAIDTQDTTTKIELLTGGEPDSTNVVQITLRVIAWNAAGEAIDPSLITLLGLTPDTNGHVTITNVENALIDCTPALPAGYTNYGFDVQLHSPGCECAAPPPDLKIKIYFDTDTLAFQTATNYTTGPNDITDKYVQAVIGQRILPYVEVPPGYPNLTYAWTIPGTNVASSDLTSFNTNAQWNTNVILTNSTTGFNWVKGGTHAVRCTVKSGGVVLGTVRTTFVVYEPQVNWLGRTSGVVSLDTEYWDNSTKVLTPWLHFGHRTSSNVGVFLTLTNVSITSRLTAYSFAYLQVGTMDLQVNLTSQRSERYSEFGLDGGGAVFGQATNAVIDDSPGQSVPFRIGEVQTKRSDNYSSYLTFKPFPSNPASIQVPVRVIQWRWFGAATNSNTNTGTGTWSQAGTGSGNVTASNLAVPFNSFPRWTLELNPYVNTRWKLFTNSWFTIP